MDLPKISLKKTFRIAAGFLILIFIQFISEKIIHFAGINFPSTILGMIIFALLLNFKIIPLWLIKDICNISISILPALFVPLFVGVSAYYNIIKGDLAGILAVIILATFITMVLTAIFVDKIMLWTGKKACTNTSCGFNKNSSSFQKDKVVEHV